MIGIYARVSTSEQASEGHSIDEQLDRLRLFCQSHSRSDIKEYVDPGFTGSNMDRPALQDLIADVRAGMIDKVVVYKLDRLSRSQKDTLELIENVFTRNGCDFESMTERFDTGTSFGKAMIGILAVFAQLEREQIKERMSMGKTGRAKEGKYSGGGLKPYGYKYADGELTIDEDEAQIVRKIFNYAIDGHSVNGIAKLLEAQGYVGRSGKPISHTTVKQILRNELYIGRVKFKGEYFDGNHEPIVTVEEFRQAEKVRLMYSEGNRPGEKHATLLGGLIYCKQCGARYYYQKCKPASNGPGIDPEKYRFYACRSRWQTVKSMVKDPSCKNKLYKVKELDEIVLNEIRKLKLDTSGIDAEIKKKQASEDKEIRDARSELKKIDEKYSRLIDLYSDGSIDARILKAKIDTLQTRREYLSDLIAKGHERQRRELSAAEARQIINSFDDIIDRADDGELIALVRTLIEKIEIDGEDIYIHWRF